jgi:hypothetical protein
MQDALIAAGTDAVAQLVEIVRGSDKYHRVGAVFILCEMDRFVPKDHLLIPEWGEFYPVRPLNLSGMPNRFMNIDGRRIGKEGLEVVMWAANQVEDKDLRFHARKCSGLLEKDYGQLSLDAQLIQWKEYAVVLGSKGPHGFDPDIVSRQFYLERAILSRPVEQFLPPLIEMLERDPDPYLQTELVTLISQVDSLRMRLRGTALGRKAVTAIRTACERGHLKAFHRKVDGLELWKELSQRFLYDEIIVLPTRDWVIMAEAFRKLYPGSRAKPLNPRAEDGKATPVLREFVAYLTLVDPYFPSRLCRATDKGDILRPDFREMTDLCYQQWENFQGKPGETGDKPGQTGDRRGVF